MLNTYSLLLVSPILVYYNISFDFCKYFYTLNVDVSIFIVNKLSKVTCTK